MTQEQKALEILKALAETAAAGNSLTIAEDWGYGSATLIDKDGAHTHFGNDHSENEEKNFEAFVNGLHGLLVESRGLSWVKPSIDGVVYVPESETRESAKGVRYIPACEVTDAQREQALKSELYKQGDMRIVWVNEGDMYAFWKLSAQRMIYLKNAIYSVVYSIVIPDRLDFFVKITP